MNRLGIMVDISHTAESTTLDAARVSRAPIIASHSSVKALCDVPRNLSDRGLKAVAGTGGVVQIVAYDSYLRKDGPEEQAAREAAIDRFRKNHDRDALMATMSQLDQRYGRATVQDLVDHIDYAVKLIGIDHVGIASDFGGGGGIDGWNNAAETGNVTAELVKRGYSADDIGKLWSGNILRVLQAVQDYAASQVAAKASAQVR
jgi:membrane dipeptidase